jgi:hypothetical protein
LKNHGLLICAGLWYQMRPPPMWKKRRIIINLQVHPPPRIKRLFKWVT